MPAHMHQAEIYAITAIISAFLIGLVYGRMRLALHRQAIESSFVYMLRFFVLFNVVDAFWGLCYAGIFSSQLVFTLVAYGYHILLSASGFAWMLYILQFTNYNRKIYKTALSLAFLLLGLQLIIIISNPFHHLVFDISNNGIVVHDLRVAIFGLQFAYYIIILFGSFILARYCEDSYKKHYQTAIIYSIAPALFCIGQYIFYDIAMYSLGFAYMSILICVYRQSFRIEKLRQEQFKSISHEQLSIIRSLAGNFMGIYYVDILTGQYDSFVKADTAMGLEAVHNNQTNFFQMAAEWGRKYLADEDLEQFLLTVDKDNIIRLLAQKSEISMIMKIKHGDKQLYHEGKITKSLGEDGQNRIVVAVYNIDTEYREQLRQKEKLSLALDEKNNLEYTVHRDIMTGLYNRRAFEDHLEELGGKPDSKNYVYVSLDVNGLKAVNDDLGHDAGDELIKGAALCMKQCFSPYGKVYRHGGDEFSAMLHVENDNLKNLFKHFEQVVSEWTGKKVDNLAISYGYASVNESPKATIMELEKLADQRMYEYKISYYARNGIDRRAQQEAYDALRESYIKVLKVDLGNDTFSIIKADTREMDCSFGFSDKFSEWIFYFAKSGHIHENDLEEYLEKIDIDNLKNFFDNSFGSFAFRYKRKTEDDFREAMMEIIPAKEYSADNQIVFLYVKNVAGDGAYLRLQELKEDAELTVQMLWEHNTLEFSSSLVKKDHLGIYIKPYMRGAHPLKFDIFLTDTIQCKLFAIDPSAGRRIVWNDVELKTVEEPEGILYFVSTKEFNQYSRPGERRIHRRTENSRIAQVSDMTFTTVEVIVHDISDTGISFYTDEPVSFSSDIISVKFADNINGERFSISTTAKIVRNYIEQGKRFYGCLIVDPPMDYQLYVFMHKVNSGHHN